MMQVRDLMSTNLLTMHPTDNVHLADVFMKWRHLRHLPVVETDNRIVGLVTHRDLLGASVSSLAKPTKREQAEIQRSVQVDTIMQTDLVTVAPDMGCAEAASIMRSKKIGCLLVTEDERLIGLVTEADFLSLCWRTEVIWTGDNLISGQGQSYQSVRDLMTQDPDTLKVGTKLAVAMELMDWAHIRHIPVVTKSGQLTGLLTHRDILRATVSPKHMSSNRAIYYYFNVEDVMRNDVLFTTPDTPLREAAGVMLEKKYGCLPVMDHKKIVGIITESDFLKLTESVQKLS